MINIKGSLLKTAKETITHHKLLSGGVALLVLTLILFGDVLFLSPQRILSRLGTDLSSQFVHWRYFGFSQLKQGVLPLWNPHIYSGTPYVGGFQSAMFYPFNLLFAIMPLSSAVNYSIALHVFLLGFFMYLWVLSRGLNPVAALLAGILAMFCGAVFPHIYAGHLPNLCVMPWVPLLFYSMDRYSEKPALGPLLLGVCSVSMQILAGHPQYVFYIGVSAVLYLLLNLFFTRYRLKTVIGLVVIYISAALLSAVQLFTGLAAATESARSGSVPRDFAAMFSFPYENLLTLITPGFFGNMEGLPYWGRHYLWEMSLFISITGLVLAVYGAIHAEKKLRLPSLILISVLLIFAFGRYTPLFDLLYNVVPGFNKFRGFSKFIFPASLFLILLSAAGLHTLLQEAAAPLEDKARKRKGGNSANAQSNKAQKHSAFIAFPIALGMLLLFMGGVFLLLDNEAFQPVIRFVLESNESYFPREQLGNQTFLQEARLNAGYRFLWAGALSLIVSLLIYLGKRRRDFLLLLPVLALAELLIFALPLRPTFNIQDVEKPELKQALAAMPGDYRILYAGDTNTVMTLGASDVWGYDPMVLKRYAEFMAYTQGESPDKAGQYLDINKYHPLYKLLRFRFVIPDQARTSREWIEFPGIMKRLNLIYNFTILKERDSILSGLSKPTFNPEQSVILETMPNVVPQAPAENAHVDLVDSSVNHLTIKADLSSPAILLVTDLNASGWQAKALAESEQRDYQVLAADYILKAIPLKAGHHLFRLFYQPQAFIIGAWISGLSLLGLIGCSLLYYVRVARKRPM